MRKIAWLFLAAALIWPVTLTAQSEDYYGNSFARVTYVKGDAVVERAGDLGSEAATVNLALVEGDKLVTRDGRVEVQFSQKNYLRIDQGTEVEFSNLPRRGDDRTVLHVLAGNVYLRINALEAEKSFELHSPDASFYVLEPGLYRLDVRGNAETELTALEGSVEAAGEGGSQVVANREKIVASNGRLGSQGSSSYRRDEFDYFNEERDSLHSQYVSRKYLPSDLNDYEEELADNGSWVYERPYGYVWVPTIHYDDWRPYYYGYWNWYATCGWTWIPYESWGWAVYHYGRWHWRLGLGWYWIPHHAWGPAWVHWYHGYDYFGWCPLSWYNYPVVIYNNHFYDRYHGSHFPADNRALTVVHRGQLQNRHISNVALNRAEAARLGRVSLEARQPDIKPTISRSGLRSVSPSQGGVQPQIRSFGRTTGTLSPGSSSRINRGSSLGQNPEPSASHQGDTGRTVSPGSLSRSGGVRTYPGSASRSSSSVGSYSPSPRVSAPNQSSGSGRQVTPRRYSPDASVSRYGTTSSGSRSSSGIQREPRNSSASQSGGQAPGSRSSVRSYSPSPRVSAPEQRSSSGRQGTPRRYTPNASISRYGTSLGSSYPGSTLREPGSSSGRRAQEWKPSDLGRSQSSTYRPSPWPPDPYPATRRDYSVGGGSASSPRSVFSAPRGSSSPRSSGYSAPSSFRSAPSISSGSRSGGSASSGSRSGPSRSSSPSHGSSGRVSRRGG